MTANDGSSQRGSVRSSGGRPSKRKLAVPDEPDATQARDEQVRRLMTWAWRDAAMEPQRRSASKPRSASPRRLRMRKAIIAARAAMTTDVDREAG
jgi:hypothetical protein